MSDSAAPPVQDRLSNYPYVVVTLACRFCTRKGQYRLARLAAKYGAEVHMQTVLRYLAGDCEYWRPSHPYKQGCGAHFCDLETTTRPPDLPAGMLELRLVKGGKA